MATDNAPHKPVDRRPEGRGVLVVYANGIAQQWSQLPAQIEDFLDLTFLAVRREEAQVTECWFPDESVKQKLVSRVKAVGLS